MNKGRMIQLDEKSIKKIKEINELIGLKVLAKNYSSINENIDIVEEPKDSLPWVIDKEFADCGYTNEWILKHSKEIGTELTRCFNTFIEDYEKELPQYIAEFGMCFVDTILSESINTEEEIDKEISLKAKLNFSIILALYIKNKTNDRRPVRILESLGVF